jgi:hypothetical protein
MFRMPLYAERILRRRLKGFGQNGYVAGIAIGRRRKVSPGGAKP